MEYQDHMGLGVRGHEAWGLAVGMRELTDAARSNAIRVFPVLRVRQ